MEIVKTRVPLDYKVKRSGEITRLKVLEYGKEEFNILEWAQRNTTFGPNYLIRNDEIFEVLPPSYRPDFKGTPDEAIVVVVISGTSSNKALDYLKEHLRPKITKNDQADKPDPVRSTGKGKKGSK